MKLSDSDRLLRHLSDGKPHGHAELYRMNLMVHSRIADLRKRGHDITCKRVGSQYVYELLRPGEQLSLVERRQVA